jgi:3D (Asp-Asp-Asp) domain-containing protein
MLNKACRMNRRRLGILRIAAIIVGFGCLIHFTHRECAKNTDRPVRESLISADSAGKTLPSSKSRSLEVFHATAYCLTGITTTGVPTAPGYVSADPKVIPLGSMIYVETPLMSGIYQVMDTGELIKGKIIDIFIPSYEACKDFGRRVVKVKVLRYGFQEEPPAKKSSK